MFIMFKRSHGVGILRRPHKKEMMTIVKNMGNRVNKIYDKKSYVLWEGWYVYLPVKIVASNLHGNSVYMIYDKKKVGTFIE